MCFKKRAREGTRREFLCEELGFQKLLLQGISIQKKISCPKRKSCLSEKRVDEARPCANCIRTCRSSLELRKSIYGYRPPWFGFRKVHVRCATTHLSTLSTCLDFRAQWHTPHNGCVLEDEKENNNIKSLRRFTIPCIVRVLGMQPYILPKNLKNELQAKTTLLSGERFKYCTHRLTKFQKLAQMCSRNGTMTCSYSIALVSY